MSKLEHKILFGIVLFTVFSSVIVINDSFGQTNNIPELLSDVPQIEIAQNSKLLLDEAPSLPSNNLIRESKQVYANISVFEQDAFTITTFNETITITKDSSEVKDDYTVWWGTTNDGYNANFLIFDDSTIQASIQTAQTKYNIGSTGLDTIHILKDINVLQIGSEHGTNSNSMENIGMDFDGLPQLIQDDIELFVNSYVGGRDYTENTVTITLVVGYTTVADNENDKLDRMIRSAVSDANRSYRINGLPIVLDLVDMDKVRGYVEEINEPNTPGIINDLYNLLDVNNANNPTNLNRLRAVAVNENADVLVLITHYDEDTNPNPCGAAPYSPVRADHSVAVIKDSCLVNLSLPHEIGHILGADHDLKNNVLNGIPFAFQHGHYSTPSRERTIMSYDCPGGCFRIGQWSDPNETYGNRGQVQAGSEAHHFNAKVLYGNAQYIASLRGTSERYDVVSPIGTFEWTGEQNSKIFNQGDTMNIRASFDEPIHDDHPPTVIISDTNNHSTDYVMDRVSSTVFTKDHTFTNEVGTVTLQFSKAQDLFTNPITTTATGNTGTLQVKAPDEISPVITLTGVTPPLEVRVDTYTELGATVTDNDPNYSGTVTVGGDTVDTNIVGTYTVTYNAPDDAAGNTPDEVTRNVIVQDTIPPRIDTITRQTPTIESTSDSTVTFRVTFDEPVTGVDELDFITGGNATSSVTGITANSESQYDVTVDVTKSGTVSLGLNSVHGIADMAATPNLLTNITPVNDAQTFTVTLPDNTAPVITTPKDIMVEATGIKTTLTLTPPTVTDDSGQSIIPTNNATSDGFPLGDTIITWSATDSSDNTATATQTITIQDTTPPEITAPVDVTVEATGIKTLVILDEPIASDIFLHKTDDDTNQKFILGNTIVTFTAIDTSGNNSTDTMNVTIIDTTPPIITILGDAKISILFGSTYTDVGATASDIYDGNLTSSVTINNSVDTSSSGKYFVTYDVTDSSGNNAEQKTRTVTVQNKISSGPLLSESFDGLYSALKSAVDENINGTGWSHDAPSGWSITNSDHTANNGVTEWQGWSFATKDFWQGTQAGQGRELFLSGSDIIAVADPDEWNDKGNPVASGTFNSTLSTPDISVNDYSTIYLGFSSHYKQMSNQTGTVSVSFDGDSTTQHVLEYGPTSNYINHGSDAPNQYVHIPINIPTDVTTMKIHYTLDNAGNDWYWGIDNITVSDVPLVDDSPEYTIPFTESFDDMKQDAYTPYHENIPKYQTQKVWTHNTPDSWSIDNSNMLLWPQGVLEWQGWSIADKSFWADTDSTQKRSQFTKGSGMILVADPDEWNDRQSPAIYGNFDSVISTPHIIVNDIDTLNLSFDTHYRQMSNQTGTVVVSYYDTNNNIISTPTEMLRYDDNLTSDNSGADVLDSTINVPLIVPSSAESLIISWRLADAGNDWYWGIDNISITK